MKAGRAMLRKYGDVHIVEMGHRGSEGGEGDAQKYGDVHIVEMGHRGSEGGEGDAQKVWGNSYSRNGASRK